MFQEKTRQWRSVLLASYFVVPSKVRKPIKKGKAIDGNPARILFSQFNLPVQSLL